MAINPQKVLLIRNTNAAVATLSQTTSDWYATARGLTGSGGATDYYWVGFDLGDKSYVTAGTKVVAGVPSIDGASAVVCNSCSSKISSAYINVRLPDALASIGAAYGIEAVFVLPGVPTRVDNNIDQQGYNSFQFTELFLASAANENPSISHFYIDPAPKRTLRGNMGPSTIDATVTGTNGISHTGAAYPLTDIRTLAIPRGLAACSIYSGRVGWVLSDGSGQDPNYPYAIGCSTLTDVQTIVNNAIAAEQVDNFSQLHVLGGTAYIYGGGVLDGVSTNHLADSAGITNLTYIEGLMGIGYSEASWWPGNPYPVAVNGNGARPYWWGGATAAQVFKSTCPPAKALSMNPAYTSGDPGDQYITGYGGAKTQPFALMSPRVGPKLSDSRCTNGLSFAPGGFAYAWMSAAAVLQEYCLRTGGSLAFGCGAEPSSAGLLGSDGLLFWLLNGFTGAEACYKAGENWYYTGAVAGWRFDSNSAQPETYPNTSFNTDDYPKRVSAHGDPLYAPYKAHNLQPRLMQVG